MKKTLLLAVCCCSVGWLSAQQFVLEANSETKTTFRHELQERPVTTRLIDGTQYAQYANTYRIKTLEARAPELPMFSESVILPNTRSYSLNVTYSEFQEYQNVNVLPSIGSLK